MGTGEKPFACNYCNKKFAQSSEKKMHEKIHTGEKPFACKYCDKKFILSSGQKRHERIHTGDNQKEKDRKKCKCDICGKVISTKQILRNHQIKRNMKGYTLVKKHLHVN